MTSLGTQATSVGERRTRREELGFRVVRCSSLATHGGEAGPRSGANSPTGLLASGTGRNPAVLYQPQEMSQRNPGTQTVVLIHLPDEGASGQRFVILGRFKEPPEQFRQNLGLDESRQTPRQGGADPQRVFRTRSERELLGAVQNMRRIVTK